MTANRWMAEIDAERNAFLLLLSSSSPRDPFSGRAGGTTAMKRTTVAAGGAGGAFCTESETVIRDWKHPSSINRPLRLADSHCI